MFGLSERLYLIATMVPDGAMVCDVGTDHGYLAAALCKSGRVKSVIATDINEKPLLHAKETVKRLKCEDIELRLCDGLDGVGSNEADTVIVAGMGGEVIAGILSRAEWVKNEKVTLILQPMTSAFLLREYLYKNGFDILKEPTLKENGKVYSVMLVRYDGKKHNADKYSCCVGKIELLNDSDFEYIKKQYKRVSQCACRLAEVEEKSAEYKEYNELSIKLKEILEEKNVI